MGLVTRTLTCTEAGDTRVGRSRFDLREASRSTPWPTFCSFYNTNSASATTTTNIANKKTPLFGSFHQYTELRCNDGITASVGLFV